MNKNNKKGAAQGGADNAKDPADAAKQLDYLGSARGYTQNFGPARQSGYQKGAAKVNEIMGKGAAQQEGKGLNSPFVKKLETTVKQGLKDVGYQAYDLLTPDPIRSKYFALNEPRRMKSRDEKIKKEENKNYDVSEQLVKEGKSFGSMASWFRDSGWGGLFGGSRQKYGGNKGDEDESKRDYEK